MHEVGNERWKPHLRGSHATALSAPENSRRRNLNNLPSAKTSIPSACIYPATASGRAALTAEEACALHAEMREFMDYVHSAFYEATGWDHDNSYATLNATADGRSNLEYPLRLVASVA